MRIAVSLALGALFVGVLAAVLLTFVDAYSGSSCEVTPGRVETCSDTSRTLVEENGRWVLLLLAVPVALAAGVLLAIRYRMPVVIEWLLASIAFAGCALAIFSVGIFFLPMTFLLFAAALTDRRGATAS
jgi:hypothetical protein